MKPWVIAAFTTFLCAQPQFQYPVRGKVAELLRSDEAFRPLAAQIRANLEPLLRDKIDDNAVRQDLLSTLMMLDLLEGRTEAARRRMDEIRALERTPAARALSNLTTRAMLDAAPHPPGSPAYRAAIAASIRATLDALAFELLQSGLRALKEKLDLPVNEAQLIAQLSATLDPIIEKTGSFPSGVAHGLPGLRFSLVHELPVRATLSEALGTYLASHTTGR